MNRYSKKIPVIAVVGPTASGKTQVSIDIALNFSGEIISADSMQIYREFNISTAKPTAIQLKQVKHYLIDEISVKDNFSVVEYVNKAHNYIKEIHNKGKVPVLVGGTGLYIDSLLNNIKFEENKTSEDTRKRLYERFNVENENLHEELVRIDPKTARDIHPNNTKKVIRALEFYYSNGYPISEQVENSKLEESPYTATFIGLNFRNREFLYDRINKRVDNMLDEGLVDEIKNISSEFIGDTAKSAIGYKEMLPYINGECSLSESIDALKRATRRYAKRQITWFKRNKNINWIYVDDYSSFSDVILEAKRIIKENCYSEIF